MATRSRPDVIGGRNVSAFLSMLALSEGTQQVPGSDDGYKVIVGSTVAKPHLFQSYAEHPNLLVVINSELRSTAAGRYQFLSRTWLSLQKKLALPDFNPENQDRAAIELLRECSAMPLIVMGHIQAAISMAAPIWASLPGAGYGQREHRIDQLMAWFEAARKALPNDFSNVVAGSESTAPKMP